MNDACAVAEERRRCFKGCEDLDRPRTVVAEPAEFAGIAIGRERSDAEFSKPSYLAGNTSLLHAGGMHFCGHRTLLCVGRDGQNRTVSGMFVFRLQIRILMARFGLLD